MNDDERLQARRGHRAGATSGASSAAFAAQMPFAEDLLTVYYCAFDRTTPTYVRVALFGALPISSIRSTHSRLLPIIGLTDDAAVMAGAIKLVWDQIKPEHRDAARDALERMNAAKG